MHKDSSVKSSDSIFTLGLFEADAACRASLRKGLEDTDSVNILHEGDRCDEVIHTCQQQCPDVVWLDMTMDKKMTGIEVGVQLRQHYPELPIIFYTACENVTDLHLLPGSGFLTHYAVLSKLTYRLPEQFLAIIREIHLGRSVVDPNIAHSIKSACRQNVDSPLTKLSSVELEVIERLALGMTNDEIARDIGMKDSRTVSRVNGSIYAAWGLPTSGSFEKVARTRATLIFLTETLLNWEESGRPVIVGKNGQKQSWTIPDDIRRRLRT